MPKIFISYRREDAKYPADRLHTVLKRHVADARRDIFIDVDNIPAGVDFVHHLDGKVAECDVLLALIGPHWLDARDPKTGRRRLDDPQDFVRIEIASALKRGVQVAPILLDGAPVPEADDLPDDLKPLSRRNAVKINRETFDADAERMVRMLDLRRVGGRSTPQASPYPVRRTSERSQGWAAPAVALAVLAVAGAGVWFFVVKPPEASTAAVDAVVPQTGPSSGGLSSAPAEQAALVQPSAAVVPASPSATAWGAVDKRKAASLRQFLKDFAAAPEAESAKLILAKLDADGWAAALGDGTAAGIRTYTASYCAALVTPQGAYCGEASKRTAALSRSVPQPASLPPATISSPLPATVVPSAAPEPVAPKIAAPAPLDADDQAWKEAQATRGYNQYLRLFPKGRHVAEAKAEAIETLIKPANEEVARVIGQSSDAIARLGSSTRAATYQESAEIMRIYCVVCHKPTGIGPFALNSYETTKLFGGMIASTLKRADSHAAPLTMPIPQNLRQRMIGWIEAGAPRGSGADPLKN